MKTKIILILSACVSLLAACKSQYELLLEGNDADAKFAAAMDYFERGKYQKSAQLFESLSVLTSGTDRDDTVQYYWGLSNYKFKDYYTAETNFETFLEHFPRSAFSHDAAFYRIDCLYRDTYRYELDQTPTYKAITEISHFMVENPDTPKMEECKKMVDALSLRLQKKAFENAKLYYRMEDYKAARVALMNVLKEDSENSYREEILYLTAMSSYKYAFNSIPQKQKERYLIFADDYLNFIGEYPESKWRPELDNLYKKLKK